MNIESYIREKAVSSRAAADALALMSTEEKNAQLLAMADALERAYDEIVAANAEDVEKARDAHLAPSLVDRLTLTKERFDAMVEGVRHVATLPDPVGAELSKCIRPSGIAS